MTESTEFVPTLAGVAQPAVTRRGLMEIAGVTFVGTVFLFVCWRRAIKGHFTQDRHFGFEAAAWYWHFVDVVWLFLFIAVYWWGGTIGTGTPLPH